MNNVKVKPVGGEWSETALTRAYRMNQKMMRYPELIQDMREIFRTALARKGIITKQALEEEAEAVERDEQGACSPEAKGEYVDALTDLYFAQYFTDAEIEDHINFARKKENFRKLNRIVNTEGVTSIRIKDALRDFCDIPQGDLLISPSEAVGVRVGLINHFISNQLPFLGVAKSHLTVRDIDDIVDHCYWDRRRPGRIGGKAAGMLLAHRIVLPRFSERDPELDQHVCMPESYYFNSGIFSDFLSHNNLDRFHSQKYKTRDEIEAEYHLLEELFRKAEYPPDVVAMFRDFLHRVGEHPLILRSSTLLEDNFGFAFSGKYDSIFVTNQGDLETRLEEFIWGLKRVHMSTYGPGPILYRRDHNLLDFDERMAVLVQKVVGRRFGDYFFPFAAGVGYSYNAYRWSPRIRAEDGLVRLVFGLGTRAVDRVGRDYARMVPLSHPTLRPEVDAEQIAKYSQKMVDVLNLRTGALETHPFVELLEQLDHPAIRQAVSVNEEGHLSAPLFAGAEIDLRRSCVTFDNLLKKSPFVRIVKKVLRALHEAYGGPVDVEFAWDDEKFYLLQCRPLAIREFSGKVQVPEDIPEEKILFKTFRGISNNLVRDIEYVVFVDPRTYARLPTAEEKLQVGRAVSRVNRLLEGKRFALLGPGRWGSNDLNLGVRVGYEAINHTVVLAEVAYEEEGSTPEVSYGTHFFNDLIEASIVPVAIFPDDNGAIFRDEWLRRAPNQLVALAPEWKNLAECLHVVHLPSAANGSYLHVLLDAGNGVGLGMLAPPGEGAEGSFD